MAATLGILLVSTCGRPPAGSGGSGGGVGEASGEEVANVGGGSAGGSGEGAGGEGTEVGEGAGTGVTGGEGTEVGEGAGGEGTEVGEGAGGEGTEVGAGQVAAGEAGEKVYEWDGPCLEPTWTKDDRARCLENYDEVQCDIVEGAHLDAQNGTTYFLENRYLKTNWYGGVQYKKPFMKWGDIPPDIGVCTDTVIRAMRHAGIDLQWLVWLDMKKDEKKPKAQQKYPWGKWKKKKADANIDHRRCPILEEFFILHGDVLPTSTDADVLDTWQPGDVVYWDLQTGRYHIGIVSDDVGPSGLPLVIHNFPSPGYSCEEDALESFVIQGHFRYPPEGEEAPEVPEPDLP